MLAFLFLLFPTGQLRSPRWRPAAWFVGGVFALIAVDLLVNATRFWSDPYSPASQAGDPLVLAPLLILPPVALVVSVAAVVVRFAWSAGEERLQLKWFAAAAVLVVATFIPSNLANSVVVNVLQNLAFLCLWVAIAIAVLKYRLYEIDIVISKAVLYGSLAVFITAVYAGLVAGVGTLVGNRHSALLSALAAAVVAVAFQPARQWARRLANRVVYGRRATPYQVLSQFAQRIGSTYSAEQVLPQMAHIVADGTGAERVVVWLRVDDELRPRASSGGGRESAPLPVDGHEMPSLPDADMSVPVVHQGELLGAISVRMPKDEPLRPAGAQLVADVASQAGLVLANAGLIEDLRASRQRLVTAQDETRRRLERNIHDGAQQDLVALGIKLRLGGMTVAEDPAQAEQISASCRRTPRARWRTSVTWPGASTRRCWPTWGWPRRSTRRPASLRCRWRWRPTGSGGCRKTPSGGVFLLPGGAAKHRQIRPRLHRPDLRAGPERDPVLHRVRRRGRLRHPPHPDGLRPAEHGRPARRPRRPARGPVRPQPGHHHHRTPPRPSTSSNH
jgi:signal transduction histidine kinase